MGILKRNLERFTKKHDPMLLVSVLLISIAGLVTMHTFTPDSTFFDRQLMWIVLGFVVYFVVSMLDVRFLRSTQAVVLLYALGLLLLLAVLIFADPIQGSKRWLIVGPFVLQASDPIKLIVIALLAKYFSRRHVEIGNFKHMFISGGYVALLAGLVLLQPDFGTAVIISAIWLLMVLVSGIKKMHLLVVGLVGIVAGAGMWFFVFEEYQRNRIVTFLHPRTDIQGAGYNANQARIAVGSGQVFGKGIGYGTQSSLRFLPEHETDFIFAAFAEEWGFTGVMLLFLLYAVIIGRLILFAWRAPTNHEALFTLGVASLFIIHITVHAGMNTGLLPVTGTTIPFMSYGGSHLMVEFLALGLVASMRTHARGAHREDLIGEVL